jgi:hypothetical protein
MPTAVAVDGHAVRTWEQAAALSICRPASRTIIALAARRPMSEKNEQYQFFMSDLSQNRPRCAIPLKIAPFCQTIES